ncbi:carbohydrate-binding protein [Herbidospora sp. NBRC 101105]|uniref:carbohydrate-binding protein n=1 Tax=Herbidospora sp. NBRC 101105 TaxID=3032195 RepID=UPI0024A22F83|nr:carbohydrate-binding protein [Herbidospora sp. NBRC 101105]GLX94143.1 hypothetical protein Hesp01_20930 [Herbidospora sp. NBRC 101105]
MVEPDHPDSDYPDFDAWAARQHPARSARTTVTLGPATRAEAEKSPLMAELKKYQFPPDPAPAGSEFIKVSIVHTVRLNAGDPLLQIARSDVAAEFSTAFIQDGLGSIDTDDSTKYLETVFFPPELRADDTGGGVVTVRGLGYSVYTENTPYAGLELSSWSDWDLFSNPKAMPHTVQIRLTGWQVAGVGGQIPARLGTGAVDLTGGVPTRIALIQSDAAELPDFTAYLAQGGTLTDEPADPTAESPYELALMGENLVRVMTAIALIVSVLQWLGRAWWRRRLNWALAAGIVLLYVAGSFIVPWGAAWELIWVALICVLAVHHALRRVGPPRWRHREVLIGSAVLLAAGVAATVLTWTTGGVSVEWPALLLVVAPSVVCVLFRSSRRLAIPVAGVASGILCVVLVGGSGVLGEGGLVGLACTLVWLVVLAAAVAVSAGEWRATHALALLLGAVAVYVVQWAAGSTTQWLALTGFTAPFVLVVLLVLRLRRLGRRPAAVAAGETVASVAFLAMLLYLIPTPTIVGVASLVALAAVWWLLSGTAARRAPGFAAVTGTAHAQAVAASIHRRFMRLALRHLYRTGRARLGTGEMTTAAFEEQRTALEQAISAERPGPVDPDLAFATSGGRAPWQNGVAAFLVALAVTAPITIVYKQPFIEQTDPVMHLLSARMVFGLPLFGFLYGYFYPRVRGDRPLSKASYLLVAGLLVEVAALLPRLTGTEPAADKLGVLAIVAGEVTLLALTLGLFWEWRLMWLAREPWHRIRGFNVRGLAAPLSALAIAVVTTVGAPFANRFIGPPPSVSAEDFGRRIEAEEGSGATDVVAVDDITGGSRAVVVKEQGQRLAYRVNLGTNTATSIKIRLANGATTHNGGVLTVLQDGGTAIGAIAVPRTGGWQNWETKDVTIRQLTGLQEVVLEFRAQEEGEIVRVNWIEFR